MIRKPLFTFDDETSTGLDSVPINGIIFIQSAFGSPKTIVLTDKTTNIVDASTTIATLLGWTSQYIEASSETQNYTTQNSAYTAMNNDYIYADTSTASFIITLPLTPSAEDVIVILDVTGSFGTNNLTVSRNGQTIMALAEDILLDVDNKEYRFRFTGTDWRVMQ